MDLSVELICNLEIDGILLVIFFFEDYIVDCEDDWLVIVVEIIIDNELRVLLCVLLMIDLKWLFRDENVDWVMLVVS